MARSVLNVSAMQFDRWVIGLACAWPLALAGCGGGDAPASASHDDGGVVHDDAGGAGDASVGVACTGASPSFAAAVQPIFQASCGGELCHNGLAGPTFPYGSLVNVAAQRDTCPSAGLLVAPGSLEKSYLVRKLTGVGICPGTDRMPHRGVTLPAEDIQTIADWVCAGAKND